ncbi:MAG: hypothetical protein GC159_15865 [Phycisphaera sp.]|nr:hypothetical protein [Phycisphaera sp.]
MVVIAGVSRDFVPGGRGWRVGGVVFEGVHVRVVAERTALRAVAKRGGVDVMVDIDAQVATIRARRRGLGGRRVIAPVIADAVVAVDEDDQLLDHAQDVLIERLGHRSFRRVGPTPPGHLEHLRHVLQVV